MRELTDPERIEKFMQALGAEAREAGRVYLTGGACAVLLGWRATTVDIDLKLVPEQDRLLQALPRLKEDLRVNVELASPADFIPEVPGWESRSLFVRQVGRLTFQHYDFYAQALAKIERGHAQDLEDVRHMLEQGLVAPDQLLHCFKEIEPFLYRFPALDPASFRRKVEKISKEYLS